MRRLVSFARFLLGFRRLVAEPISVEEARRRVSEKLDRRGAMFVDLMERAVYAVAESPYRTLLRIAQCEPQDLRRSVETNGLETALAELRAAGVYLSLDEFKARHPIVRGGVQISVRPEHFDMPGVRRAFFSSTGGSSGRPVWVAVGIDRFCADLPLAVCGHAAADLVGQRTITWAGLLPAPPGVVLLAYNRGMGNEVVEWFYPPFDHGRLRNAAAKTVTRLLLASDRLGGRRPPVLRPATLDSAEAVAARARRLVDRYGRCVAGSIVSRCVRVAIAARERGIDLTGVTFVTLSEALTTARRAEIVSSGARVYPLFSMMETGLIGAGCASPVGPDDVHFSADRFALLTERDEDRREALFVTTLDAGSPKLILNVRTGDYAEVDTTECGCDLYTLGLTTRLRHIGARARLTVEGETLMVKDLERIVEQVLPERFGGSALDYQFVESEDDGVARLTLLVNHGDADEAEIETAVFDSLRRGEAAADVREQWRQAGAFTVRRAAPRQTQRGKQPAVLRESAAGTQKNGVPGHSEGT